MDKSGQIKTKEHILNQAIKLFAKEGYDGLKMDNLAKIAKVNKATIYYYYENKQTLYETIMKNLASSFYENIQENLKDKKDDLQRLETFIDSALYFVQTHRDTAKMMMIELSYEWKNISPQIKECFVPILMLLKDILESGIKNQKFNEINPLLLQGIVIGAFNYYLLMKNIFIDFNIDKKIDIQLSDGKKEIKDMILKSILKDNR